MPIINIPGVGKVRFPDEMSDKDIVDAIENNILKSPKEEPTFLQRAKAAAKRGLEEPVESVAGIGLGLKSALGMKEQASQQAAGIRYQAMQPKEGPMPTTYEELEQTYGKEGAIEALKKFPTYVAEQILQSAPSMAVPLAVGASAAALSGPAAPIVGPLAGLGTYGLQQFGQFMQRQAQEGTTGENLAPGKAAAVAAATAPLGYFADRFAFGLTRIPAKVLGEGALAELAKRTGASVTGRAATGASLGILAEAPTEVIEQIAERWQAGLPLDTEDARREYKEAFFGAAAVGGVGGAAINVLRGAPDIERRPGMDLLKPEQPSPVAPEQQTPEQVSTFTPPPSGFTADQATQLRRESAMQEQARVQEQAEIQQADQAARIKEDEGAQKAAIKRVMNTSFSADPVMQTIAQQRALEELGVPRAKANEITTADPEKQAKLIEAEAPEFIPAERGQKKPRGEALFEVTPEDKKDIADLRDNLASVNKDLKEAQAGKGNLFSYLKGKLIDRPGAFSLADIDKDNKRLRQLYNPKGQGALLEDLVADGALDEYLPFNNRAKIGMEQNENFDSQTAIEHIAEKLRNGENINEESTVRLRDLQNQKEELKSRIENLTSIPAANYELGQMAEQPREELTEAGMRDLEDDARSIGVDVDSFREELSENMPNASIEEFKGAYQSALFAATSKSPSYSIEGNQYTEQEIETAIGERFTENEINELIAETEAQQTTVTETAEVSESAAQVAAPLRRADETKAEATTTLEKPVQGARVAKQGLPPILPELDKTPAGRHPQVAAAAKLRDEGKISREEFEEYVNAYKKIEPVSAEVLSPPAPDEQIYKALRGDKAKSRLNPKIKDGTRVGLRMDLPAREAGTNVVSIHEGKENDNPKTGKPYSSAGDVIGYSSTARITDVKFAPRDQVKGIKMAYLPEKNPLQTAEGLWVNESPQAIYDRVMQLMKSGDPAWTQVNFDPGRHGYFYNRKTADPVIAADELLQVGNFLLAKNVQYGQKQDFLYSQKGPGRITKAVMSVVNSKQTKMQKELTGKTMIEAAQWAVNNAPNPFAKLTANKTLAMIKELQGRGVIFNFEVQSGDERSSMLRRAEGVTHFLTGKEGTKITVFLNGAPVFVDQRGFPSGMSYDTLLHELLHVATRISTKFLPRNHPLIKDLNELFDTVLRKYNEDREAGKLPPILERFNKRMNNVLFSADELISWGMNDKEFQKYLSEIKVGEKTAFSKLIELVRKLIGMAKPFETALDRLVRTTEGLLELDTEYLQNEMVLQTYSLGKPAPVQKAKPVPMRQQALFQRSTPVMQDTLEVRREGFFFDAKDSPLYQKRSAEDIKYPTKEQTAAAIARNAIARKIMQDRGNVANGAYVGLRQDLNIKDANLLAVHQGKESLHEKGAGFFSGDVQTYLPVATLKNVYFKIRQTTREAIAEGREFKSKMGSADGQIVKTDQPNFDGIELRFNPFREHLFVDAVGRAVKYVDEATIVAGRAFARGNIEYYGEEDAPARAGTAPTAARLMGQGEGQIKPIIDEPNGNVSISQQQSLFMQQGIDKYPYSNAPKNLMGFPKNRPAKGFEQEKYKHVEFVKVTFDNGEQIYDAIKGLNKSHALARARLNWSGAKIESVSKEKIAQEDPGLISEALSKQAAPTPTLIGQQSLEILSGMGREPKAPDPGYVQRVRQSWDNAVDNPKATAQAAQSGFRKYADMIETYTMSSDAALNNQIRRAIMDSTLGQEEKIGALMNVSLSQTVHSDAISNLFLMKGDVKFNKELSKWEGVDSEYNIVNLSKKLDDIAAKYGLTKEQIQLISHTAFESKRTKSLIEFNAQIDAEVEQLNAMASEELSNGEELKASVLREKASSLKMRQKYIHMTDEDVRAGMTQFKLMPELSDAVAIWNGIRGNAVKTLVSSGLWTEAEAEFLLSNASYVPFYREDQLEQGKGPKEFMRSLQVQAKERRLKGTDRPVNDIFDNMVRWTQYSINRAVRNRSAVALAQTAESVGLATRVSSKSDGDNVISVWQDGGEVFYNMEDPMFMQAFQGLESISIPTIRWAAKVADVLRQSVVLYPLFSVAQIPQDSYAAMFSSGLKPQHALTIPFRAVKEFLLTLANKSKTHNELKNFGVVGVRDFTSAMVRNDAEVYAGLKAPPGMIGNIKNALSHIAMASDNAVRQATYLAAQAQGLSQSESLEKAFEIFNVRRKGSSRMLAMAGQLIPFFNAYLAAQTVAYKTITGVGTSPTQRAEAYKVLFSTTASVMTLSVLYSMMNGDDEDYLNKPTPTRDRLLMIPGTGGMSIPLRSDLFTLPKVIAEHTYLLLTDNGYADGRKFRDSIATVLANAFLSPTAVPQAIKPLIEVGINYDFFQGKPLIGVFQKNLETERQFTDSTSELAKLLSGVPVYYSFANNQFEGLSPIAIDHLVRGMFGSIGGLVMYATNPFLWSDPNVPRPDLSLRNALSTIPNASGFISKEYEGALRKDFYQLREAVNKASSTLADLKQRSPDKIEDYITNEAVRNRLGLAPTVEGIARNLTKIRQSITQITNSQMPADEKASQIRSLREAEREMLKGVNLKEMREFAKI